MHWLNLMYLQNKSNTSIPIIPLTTLKSKRKLIHSSSFTQTGPSFQRVPQDCLIDLAWTKASSAIPDRIVPVHLTAILIESRHRDHRRNMVKTLSTVHPTNICSCWTKPCETLWSKMCSTANSSYCNCVAFCKMWVLVRRRLAGKLDEK